MLFKVKTVDDLGVLFPSTCDELKKLVKREYKEIEAKFKVLYGLGASQKTFQTTFLAFDRIQSHVASLRALLHLLHWVHPLKSVRKAAEIHIQELDEYMYSAVTRPFSLYKELTSLVNFLTKQTLSTVERRFIEQCLKIWALDGVYLAPSKKERLLYLEREIATNVAAFELNVTQDNRMVHKVNNQLQGIPRDYIRYFSRAHDGCYALSPDVYILESSSYEPTRLDFWRMAVNRGYPVNHKKLITIIAFRDRLARTLGFQSYAQVDIRNQMAKTPEKVESFLTTIIRKCHSMLPRQMDILKQALPSDVTLTDKNIIKPWDLLYIKNHYKTNILSLDENALSEYFPVEHVLDGLLALVEEFFSVRFEKKGGRIAWDEKVTILEMYKDGILRGFIVLDLFWRPDKYLAMFEQPIVLPIKQDDGIPLCAVTAIIASFIPPTPFLPSLLRHYDVASLFHEMGHALHTLLGAQEVPSFAGTRVKRDFVEMPSQVLEHFAWVPWVLKKITAHYKTGEPLPDELIEKLNSYRYFDSVDLTLEQCYLAMLSLQYLKEGSYKDIFGLHKRLSKEIRSHLMFSNEDHSYAAFDHLGGYGAKYYGYLWARVFAYDIFSYIQKQMLEGVSLGAIGGRYVTEIISKGGSEDPGILLKNFLGREPSLEPFFEILNLR
jgi:thimet oligopeptidase